jgi:hypothetical protein
MATQVQLRRGTSTQNDSFTGAQGELTFDTTNKRVRIHDGATAGGFELKTENAGGDTLFADNEKAIFGAGSDLQIYHNGGDSLIADTGAGDLYIRGSNNIFLQKGDGSETFIATADDGAVTLYHDNAAKLATTSTGIDVTGTVTSDGLTMDGTAGISVTSGDNLTLTKPTGAYLVFHDGTQKRAGINGLNTVDGMAFTTGTNTERMRIDSSGRVGIGTTSLGGGRGLTVANGAISVTSANLSHSTSSLVLSQNDSSLSQIRFYGANTSTAGILQFDGSSSDGSVGGERMRIDSSGNVGIGLSTNIASKLHVNSELSLGPDNNNRMIVGSTSGGVGSIGTIENGTASFSTMTFKGGNVGIGTSSPSNQLHLQRSADTGVVIENSAASMATLSLLATGASRIRSSGVLIFDTGGATERMRIDSSGYVGIGTSSPSRNLTVSSSGQTDLAIIAASGSSAQLCFGDGDDDNVGQIEYSHPTDSMRLYTQGTERMRIDSSGNVGIGTSPSANLHLKSTTSGDPELRIEGSGTNNGIITFLGGGHANPAVGIRYISSGDSAGHLAFYANGSSSSTLSERMRIDSSGNLLVGTSSSSASSGEGVKFRIESNAKTISTTSNRSTSADEGITMWSTGANAWRFYVGWGGKINATSNTIQAISDQRFKENIRDLDDGLSKVMELRPRKFDWKEGKGADIKDDRGFIAQEFEEVFPDLVGVWKDEPPEGEEPYKAVSQDLIPTLVKAIQELSAKNDALEVRITTLEG